MKASEFERTEFEETPIGRIPKDWELVQLGKVMHINRESCDPKRDFPEKRFLYIDIDSIQNETGVIKRAKTIIGKEAPSRARRLIRYNDVIMSTVRPYLKAFAIVPKEYDAQICSTGFAVFRCKERILPYYLLYTLFSNFIIGQCNRMMVGGQYPALNDSQVKKIQLPLPPLPEQQKIAEILSTVDEAIEKTDQAIDKTRRLKKGLMQELLTKGIGHKEFKDTEIGRIPKEWEVVRLSKVFKLASGKARPPEFSDIANENMPYPIYGGNGILGFTNKFMIDKETIVIGRVGEYCGSIHRTSKFAWISDNALYAIEMQSHYSKLAFLTYYLTFMNLNRLKKKSGQPLMTQAIVYSILLPLPPLPEQQKIAEILGAVDKRLEFLRMRREKLERVKKGLMDDLLTGKRRVKI